MRARSWVALGALALAIAILVPALTPLSGSMDAFASDLASGGFRPFGQLGGGPGGGPVAYTGQLGGLTGSSSGNYLPGAQELPRTWELDRDGRGQQVTIDYVFNPSLGAMQRLKAYDRVGADGETLTAADTTLRPVSIDPSVRYDRVIEASFAVQFHKDQPVVVYSPHPKAVIERATVEPQLTGGVQFFKDGADTFYALGHVDRVATLNMTFRVSADYYAFDPPANARVSDYRYGGALPKPVVPQALVDDAKLVLARAGVQDPTDVGRTIDALAGYFRSFGEGDIPQPGQIESLYLALALGEHGCCRHRAFAFMVTAQSVGIPTRVVVNEAHAFVEVALPDGKWHQINLGGCGTYTVNNPHGYPNLFDQAGDPRREANPQEGDLAGVPTVTTITDSPLRIVKGERYFVNGTVLTTDDRGVPGARVDVYLNATKTTPGRLTGTGTTGPDGRFAILAKVPADAPAQGYQLVARGADGHETAVRFGESWSDPPVEVFAPTRFALGPLVAGAGFPATLRGRLVDIDGAGVPNATIRWSADGADQPDARADATGRFALTVLFNTTGPHRLGLRFDGDEHHGASQGEATVEVNAGAILLPLDAPLLVRGQPGTVNGSVVIRGAALGGREVQVRMDGVPVGQGRTADDGRFAVALRPPAGHPPGIYNATILVPSLSLDASTLVRVAAGSSIDVARPERVKPGEPWVLEATVAADNGTLVTGGLVELRVGGASTSLLTNRTGVARFEMPQAPAAGDHAARVSFAGDAERAPAVEAFTLHVARPWYAAVPSWGYGLAVAILLAAALAVPARKTLSAWVRALHRPERRFLSLAFPDHPPGVPPVFEPGEPMRVRVVVRDREGKALTVPVRLGRLHGRAQGEAGALFETKAPARGPLTLRASAAGLARLWTRPLERVVPVASYREAVEREFVRLRERAGLAPSATAGDLVDRLGGAPIVRQAAALFDVADYSEARVDRAFYHAFASAAATLGDRLEARDG